MSDIETRSSSPSGVPKMGEFQDGKLWFSRKGATVTLGITSSALEDIGDIDDIEFPSQGEDYEKGDVILTVEGTTGSLELICPATGIIEEINDAAKDSFDVVAEDPLEEGWLIKIEVQDPTDLKEFAPL